MSNLIAVYKYGVYETMGKAMQREASPWPFFSTGKWQKRIERQKNDERTKWNKENPYNG